jgi:hypothetical protein
MPYAGRVVTWMGGDDASDVAQLRPLRGMALADVL